MIEILALPFFQRALIAALLSGLLAPSVGMYIVQKRLSLLGDGLGHVAIMGVGFALMTGQAPLPVAVVTAIVGAIIVELLRQSGRASGDLGLAILFYGGLAAGVLMAGVAGQGAAGLSSFLFGSLTSVTAQDIVVIVILAIIMLGLTIGLLPRLFAVSVDEEHAETLGLRTRLLNLLIVVLAAVAVTISMRTVGLLLISALMIIPVATAQQCFVSFRGTFFGSMLFGVIAAGAGTFLSFFFDTATGATIVVTAIAMMGIAWPLGKYARRTWRFISYAPDHGEHEHEPAEPHAGIRHRSTKAGRLIEHGVHFDHVHGGHRHAAHGDHYDEH